MQHLFDGVQYPQAVAVKRKLIDFFGRTKYYRYSRGDKLISPEEQSNIKAIFVANGLSDEIEFDQYIEQYHFAGVSHF